MQEPSAPPDPPHEPQTQAGPAELRPRLRLLWLITRIAAACVVVAVVGAIAGRLYLTDERVRQLLEQQLAQRAAAPVSIEAAELALLSGFELRGLRVGSPEGFSHDVAQVGRLAVRWDLLALVSKAIVVEELVLQGVKIIVEEGEDGTNLQALMGATSQPAEDPEPSTDPAAQGLKLETPTFPLDVRVERIVVHKVFLRYESPEKSFSIDRLGSEGHFEGHAKGFDLDLWLGLGDREAHGAASHLSAEIKEPPTTVDIDQRLGLQIVARGLDDIAVNLGWTAQVDLAGERTLQDVDARGELVAAINIITQDVDISTCRWTIGQGTGFSARAQAHAVLAEPELDLREFKLFSDLGELSPLLVVAVPTLEASGRVWAELQPMRAEVSALGNIAQLVTTVKLGADRLSLAFEGKHVEGLDSEGTVSLDSGNVRYGSTVNIESLTQASAGVRQEVRSVSVEIAAQTPLAPWMVAEDPQKQAPQNENVQASVRVSVAALKQHGPAPASADGIDVTLTALAPIALLRGYETDASWVADASVFVSRAAVPEVVAKNVRMSVRAEAPVLDGSRVDLEMTIAAGAVNKTMGDEVLMLTDLGTRARIAMRGQSIEIREFKSHVADLIEVGMSGSVHRSSGLSPEFDAFRFWLAPTDMAAVVDVLPAAMKPAASIAGMAAASIELDGVVPVQELQRVASLPVARATVEAGQAQEAARMLAARADALSKWSDRFVQGLPFTASVTLQLENGAVGLPGTVVDGLDVEGSILLNASGPRIQGKVRVANVEAEGAANIKRLAGDMSLALEKGVVILNWHGGVGEFEHRTLTRPLVGAKATGALRYRLGGDALLEDFTLEAPDRDALISARGLVSKPLRIAMQRGWERQGLPGIEAQLDWKMAFGSSKLEPVIVAGPSFVGRMELGGKLQVRAGVLSLDGQFVSENVSLLAGENVVEEMNGELPFEISLAFYEHEDGTSISRTLPIAGGEVWLLTAEDDIRERPSRPIHYERLRPYRKRQELSIRSIVSGPYEIFDFELDGRMSQGMIIADRVGMRVLGGDVIGNMAIQLGRGGEVIGDMAFKTSRMDASYFKALDIKPGPESELNADVSLAFLFGPSERDLRMNMNVTKMGEDAFLRFLQLLDPLEKDENIQNFQTYLRWGVLNLHEVAMWIRYENLNMDLDYGLQIGAPIPWQPLPRELLRRYSLSGKLDVMLQPKIDAILGNALGWSHDS